jgi:hypothetical protein
LLMILFLSSSMIEVSCIKLDFVPHQEFIPCKVV